MRRCCLLEVQLQLKRREKETAVTAATTLTTCARASAGAGGGDIETGKLLFSCKNTVEAVSVVRRFSAL